MAITKFERWKTSEKNADDLAKEGDGVFDKPIYEDESPAIQLLHDKVHELTDLLNTHITKMAANDAKTGITTSQANAITANTAKTGITTSQSNMITDNMTEVKRLSGFVATNTTDIGTNTKGISNLTPEVTAAIKVGSYPPLPPFALKGTTQSHGSEIVYDKLQGKYFLNIYYMEDSSKGGGKRVIKTGQIELK
tara:strand:- start:94 stop:675 length:582 start_codon:yes stop_codon:yes gene_type:complete